MTEYSKRLKAEAKGFGIPPQSLVMAYLLACGFTDNEAYTIAYSCNEALSKERNISIRESIVQNPNYKDIVERIRGKITGNTTRPAASSGGSQQLSKEDIATILKRQMDALPDGDKAKTDAAIKYAELYQYKKDDPKDDNDYLPHIWLPMPCFLCQYKQDYDDRKKAENFKKTEKDDGEDSYDKD